MTLSETPGSLKRFRRTPWRFQQTFHTPLKNLQLFVSTILSSHQPFPSASLTVDEVVFEPRHMISLLSRYSLPPQYGHDSCITANGTQQVADLLAAALSDWVDFAFVPTPKPFVIYADHDEYTTFYANTKSNLHPVIQALSNAGFEKVLDYQRSL